MKKLHAFAFVLSLASAFACSTTVVDDPRETPSTPACEQDFECDPGTVCIAGQCAIDFVPVGDCANRNDCPDDQVCEAGGCVAPPDECDHSEQCPGELLCDGFSGSCFDPNAVGCVLDDECRLEPGCAGGCVCAAGSCSEIIDPIDPVDPPNGDPLNLDGYSVENREHSPAIQVGVLSGVTLLPGQILVIGRDATRSEFETDWGVSFGNSVVYFNNASQNGGVPVINGAEAFALLTPSGTLLDGATTPGSTGNSYQRVGADLAWVELPDAQATPGTVDLPTTGVGLVISEWSDASGSGRFPFEFIELYYAP